MTDLNPVRAGAQWSYALAENTISFDFGRVEPSRSGLAAWVEVRNGHKEGAPLHFGTYNLMGNRTVTDIAKGAPKLPADFLREAVYDVISRHLEGEPTIDLATLLGDDPPWYLLPRLVAAGGATHLIAEGGFRKSYLALAVCYTIATGSSHYLGMTPNQVGPSLYLDWEATEDTFKARSRALNGRQPPPGVHYQAQKQPLRRGADSIAKRCDELGIIFLVVDSMMLARGGDAFGPEETSAVFAALREIGRPAIVVDHKSQDAIRKGRMGAYGSIVGKNSIRLTWEITTALTTSRGSTILRLKQGKSNDIPEGPDLGFEVTFNNEGQGDNQHLKTVTFRPVDPIAILMQEAPGESQADELHRQLLDGESHTIADLVQRTGFKTDSVRKALKREPGRFEVVDKKPERWQLKDRGPRQEQLPPDFEPPEEDPF